MSYLHYLFSFVVVIAASIIRQPHNNFTAYYQLLLQSVHSVQNVFKSQKSY